MRVDCMKISKGLVSIILLLSYGMADTAISNADDTREWNFRVYLGDSPIGHHHFRLVEKDGRSRLQTEADFKVRFLFFTAYRYQHVNNETWKNDCLLAIESHTDANGRILNVRGAQGPDGFELDVPETAGSIPGCVKTFAYWNPDILDESALLNPQTGELLPVKVEKLQLDNLSVRGHSIAAQRYRLSTPDLALDVWYSQGGEWLALQSTTKDGRTLRYELM